MTILCLTDPPAWRQKAMAFVTRTHRHLWGKNNEDPLVFLFRKGFSNAFAKQMHLGWNKHGQERDLGKWGLAGAHDPAPKWLLPPGIVFPHILKKELLSVWILPMDGKEPPILVPGSRTCRIDLGPCPDTMEICRDIFRGLKRFQDAGQEKGVRIFPKVSA